MTKIIAAVIAAALITGAALIIPGLTPVQAHMMGTKGDRLDLRNYGSDCSERGWPYFETSCLRDTSSPTRQARTVRIVGSDRLANLASR